MADSLFNSSSAGLGAFYSLFHNPFSSSGSQTSSLHKGALKVQRLRNPSNSCFLNAVVQVLASLEPFHAYLESCQQTKGSIVTSLRKTVQDVAVPKTADCIIPEIAKEPQVKEFFLKSNEQQDSAEFLTYLFTWIENEQIAATKNTIPSPFIPGPVPSRGPPMSLASFMLPGRSSRVNTLFISRELALQKDSGGGNTDSDSNSTADTDTDDRDSPISRSLSSTQAVQSISIPPPVSNGHSLPTSPLATNGLVHSHKPKLVPSEKMKYTSVLEPIHSLFSPNPFYGLLESCIKCIICGYTSTKYEEFLELTLPIRSLTHNLKQCIDEFTKTEMVHYKCDACCANHKNDRLQSFARKQLSIARHPKLLCLHLHRQQQVYDGRFAKNDVQLCFEPKLDALPYSVYHRGMFAAKTLTASSNGLNPPVGPPAARKLRSPLAEDIRTSLRPLRLTSTDDIMDRSTDPDEPERAIPHMFSTSNSIDRQQINYDLVAVLVHFGGDASGHVVTYKRLLEPMGTQKQMQLTDQWVFISDDEWHMVDPIKDVFSNPTVQKNAYLLFYQRT